MLGSQQYFFGLGHFGERGITRVPGRAFKAGTGLNLNPNDLQRHTQPLTHRSAMLRPCVCRSLKAVMHMDSA
ncbi:hypothetical protein D3C76_1628720 [compost metagenome]